MADDNLKDFGVSWIQMGLLFFCLLSFAIAFIFYNNPTGLGESEDIFENTHSSLEGNLIALPSDSNALLNITAQTNPEISDLGSRDSVATSYGVAGNSKGFFESAKIFLAWILVGEVGQLLLAVFGGLFGFVSLYYITKYVRNGI